MTDPHVQVEILYEPPTPDMITDYDRQHLTIYLRLLDAEAAGADPCRVAAVLLGLDPAADPERPAGSTPGTWSVHAG